MSIFAALATGQRFGERCVANHQVELRRQLRQLRRPILHVQLVQLAEFRNRLLSHAAVGLADVGRG
jgi:hypothetical protein